MKVGYIGLGAMGGTLARHLIQTHDLVVYDLNETVLGDFRRLGARSANSAKELVEVVDVVMVCLPKSADVGELLFGKSGIATSLRAGQTVIDQTSGSPDQTANFARKLLSMGVEFIDAPVSGGIPAAQNRSVTVIVSGSDQAWKVAEPVLTAMSSKVLLCSDKVGDAQTLKLITNGIGACYRLATLEIAALGCRYGLSLRSIVSTLNEGEGANFTSRNMLVGLLDGKSTTNFAMKLMVKDLNAALDLAAETKSSMPMLCAARGLMQMAVVLFGDNAKLDDAVMLIEMLTDTGLGAGTSQKADPIVAPVPEPQLLDVLGKAVAACNAIALIEGAGVAFETNIGLDQLARVVEAGSSWSKIAARVFSERRTGASGLAGLDLLLGSLETAAALAAAAGSPFLTAGSALHSWRAATSKRHI